MSAAAIITPAPRPAPRANRGEELRTALAGYQRDPSGRSWAALTEVLRPATGALLRRYWWALGGRDDAVQAIAVAVLEATRDFDTRRPAQHVFHEFIADVLNKLATPRQREGRYAKRAVPLRAELADALRAESRDLEDALHFYRRDPVAALTRGLRPETREVFLLRARGLRFVEIARRLGVSDDTVRIRFHRGLKKLRGAFGGDL